MGSESEKAKQVTYIYNKNIIYIIIDATEIRRKG